MRFLGRVGAFWYDFIIGDDWTIAVAVVAALGATFLLAHAHIVAWWLLPVVVILFLSVSVRRGAQGRSAGDGGAALVAGWKGESHDNPGARDRYPGLDDGLEAVWDDASPARH